jgi:hypothetical protein
MTQVSEFAVVTAQPWSAVGRLRCRRDERSLTEHNPSPPISNSRPFKCRWLPPAVKLRHRPR